MTPRRQQAQDLFFQGYNCSQAVAGAFADLTGLKQDFMLRLSASFGGGFGRLREICGTVSGMGIVLGLLYSTGEDTPQEKAAHYARVQEVAKAFEARNGSLICRELLSAKVKVTTDPNPDPRTPEYFKKRPCAKLVDDAVQILEQYLESHPIPEKTAAVL